MRHVRRTGIGLAAFVASNLAATCHQHPPDGCPPYTDVHSAIAWGPVGANARGVSGRVVTVAEEPLAGAAVTFEPGHHETYADEHGHFTMPTLPRGRYYVRVRAVDYPEAYDSVTYGLGGLYVVATLAHDLGIVDLECITYKR